MLKVYDSLHWREKQVVDLLVLNPDSRDKDIAQSLHLAPHTVKIYLKRACEHYGVGGRTGLVSIRMREIYAE